MLRSEIIRAANNLHDLITRTQLHGLIVGASRASEPPPAQPIIDAYRSWVIASVGFGDAEKSILRIFRLTSLMAPEFWANMIVPQTGRARSGSVSLRRIYDGIRILEQELPQICALLQRDTDSIIDDKISSDKGSLSVELRLLLKEENNKTSSPKRLIDAIDSIALIYSVFSEIANLSSNDLAIIGCDSGSDKSIDFTGVPQIIQQTKDFIFGMWDRVVFYREKQHSERVKLVAEALPLLGQIAEMSKDGKMSPEQGELLKRRIMDGATKFLDTGSMIPELNSAAYFAPQALLQPTPTLLLQAPEGSDRKKSESRIREIQREEEEGEGEASVGEPRDSGLGELSAEEIELVKRRRRDA
jgi:hypothetical protein